MPQRATDKIVIDATSEDEASIAELLSRLEPGDKVTGTFEATLDEYDNKVGVLSITEVTVKADVEAAASATKGDDVEGDADADEAEPSKSAALSLFKKDAES